ncbi:MAG TPA: beta-ketoacyl synthase N-terminal-like domain-containing protein [Pseudomonas sp.]|uniref:beta-ketoacyl synthase N-terminal-like domain-containing protein n=1 Tax=Pseudomonas sp. TaxID=306 RepID=UPI002B6ECC2F|nr:beta-ketoacyl synthase N-terminal-like domain-containing protein [Pseudomonas sp.]HWH89018.1 beta-ketoacyl synthase N-terminal-like domain-containing protein [Pseudomonas sp.]
MTDATVQVAIAGSGCVLPSGWGVERFWSAALEGRSAISALQSPLFYSERVAAFGHVAEDDHQRSRQDVAQNLQRYCPPAVIWGVSAVRQALAEAGLEPGRDDVRFGLYCCQGGYTHPSFASYGELLHECQTGSGADMQRLAKRVLQERALDPFLVLKSLSNGLLGVVSLALKLECESNAYMQGVAGNLAALREACAALQSGRIDAAIVVGAGSELDPLALAALAEAGVIGTDGSQNLHAFDRRGRGGIAGEGAAALVLRRAGDLPARPQTCLTALFAHPRLDSLSLPDKQVDLLIGSATGDPYKDADLARALARAGAAHITSSTALTGILSGAPSLVDLILARQALQAQSIPPVCDLQQPVDVHLPFVSGGPRHAALHDCLVINRDDNGFSAGYQLQFHAAD